MEYTEKMMEAIDQALTDQAFCDTVAEAESAEAIKALFLEKGIEIDDTIANAAFEKKEKVLAGEELTPEDLELVAGGCKGCFFGYTLGGAAAGGAIGYSVAGPAGVFGGAVIGGAIGCIIGTGVAVAHDIKKMGRSKKRRR